MSCYNFSLFKCDESSATSVDDLFSSINSEDLAAMFKDPDKAVTIATENAYNIMKAQLMANTGDIKQKLNQKSGRFCDTWVKTTGTYELYSIGGYRKIEIKRLKINVNFTGTVIINIEDELGEIHEYEKEVESGITATLEINEKFEEAKISIVNDIDGKTVHGCGVSGFIVEYNEICDIDSYICDNKDLYLPLMKYKVGSILISEGLFSGTLSKRVFQKEDYEALRLEFETQYGMLIKKMDLNSCECFSCEYGVYLKTNLP